MTRKSIVFAGALTVLAPPVLADNCDPMPSGFDGVYCFAKIYHGLDAELNTAYKNLRARLTKSERQILLDAQRGWIAKRNRDCMSGASTVNLNCAIDYTRNRTRELHDLENTCKMVGCPTTQLSRF
ncbi:MAG: lysozyme inhibitor LprI family protein [Pseudomonadota bacterium]